MTTIDAFNEWTGWTGVVSSTVITETSSTYRRPHTRIAYAISQDIEALREFPATSEGWVALMIRVTTGTSSQVTGPFLEFLDSNDNPIFWLARNDGLFFETPVISEEIPIPATDLYEFDIHFKIDSTDGFFTVYLNQVEVFSFSGDTQNGFGSEITKMVLTRTSTAAGTFSSRNYFFSEILLSTEPTLGFKVLTLDLSEGAVNQWDGTPSNITPVGYASTEDSLSTEDADQLVTFSRPDIPALDEDEFISSVHLETSQLSDIGAPAPEADLLIYDGSEHGAERIQPGTSFEEFRVQWDQDPRTNEPWTEAGVNEIEVGVASRTA